MRFRHLQAGGVGPFAPGTAFTFREGLNVVEGENGAGKTNVFGLLREQYRRALEAGAATLPDCLVFMGEGDRTRPEKRDDTSVQRLLNAPSLDRPRLEADLSHAFHRVCGGGGLRGTRDVPLNIRITDTGLLEMADGERLLGPSFMAAGEHVLLHLALVQALRAQFKDGPGHPFVVDGIFGSLDSLYRQRAVTAVTAMAPQVIVLVSPGQREELGWRANFRFEREAGPESLTRVLPV